MTKDKVGKYYADDEKDYVKSKSLGMHSLASLTLENDEEDNNIYSCSATIKIKMGNGTMDSVLKTGDIRLHLMGDNLNEEIDLADLNNSNGEKTMEIYKWRNDNTNRNRKYRK